MAMMSSNFCPADDWGSLQLLNPADMNMINSFQTQQDQLAAAASGFLGLQDFTFINDPFFETYESSSENFLLPNFYSPTDNMNLVSLSPEIFPLDEYDCSYQQYSKRQKYGNDQQIHWSMPPAASTFSSNSESICNSNNFATISPSYFNGSYDQFLLQPQLSAPIIPSPQTQTQNLPAAAAAQYASGYSSEDIISAAKINNKPNSTGQVTLSAQSIAARERRRRITEKTQELGKLIPGANKMNTAEMLQSAYKYIKFLQAQVSVLKLMKQERKEERLQISEERLQVVASPIVQEKLYSEEKCLVLKEFVEVLAKDHDIQSKPLLKDNVAQLLQSNG